jgi:excinuclease UvrABC ATPase subunit
MKRSIIDSIQNYDRWATATWTGRPVHEAVDRYNGKIVKLTSNGYKRLVFNVSYKYTSKTSKIENQRPHIISIVWEIF